MPHDRPCGILLGKSGISELSSKVTLGRKSRSFFHHDAAGMGIGLAVSRSITDRHQGPHADFRFRVDHRTPPTGSWQALLAGHMHNSSVLAAVLKLH